MQIIIKGTTTCNLRCVYCSEGDKPPMILDDAVFYKLVDDLPELLDAIGDKEIDFLWHGGEPMTMGRPKLGRLMTYAKEHLSGYKVVFSMQSNGYAIDDEWIDFFKTYDVKVGISFDGLPEMHDANRPTQDGKPTAATILGNIEKMRQNGLHVGTLMVLNTAEPIDDVRLFNFITEHQLQPKIHPVIPCGRARGRDDAQKIYEKYNDLLKRLYVHCIQTEEHIIIEPLNAMMEAILGSVSIGECCFSGTCGKKFMCLYPNGGMGVCGRDNLSEVYAYGSLQTTSLLDLYESPTAQKIRSRQEYLQTHDCKDCGYWEFCHGGCAFEAVNTYGTLDHVYPHCQQRKELLVWLQTTGLELLQEALIAQKRMYRARLQERRRLLKEVSGHARE